MNTVEILKGAKALLENKGWTQRTCARSADGLEIHLDRPDAVCFCTVGAVWRFGGFLTQGSSDAERSLKAAMGIGGGSSIGHWNDAPGRTLAEVLAKFDEAIAAEEAREAQVVPA